MAELDLRSYVEHTRHEGERIVAAFETNPDAVVPNCPDWTLAGLATHCATIWATFAGVITSGSTEPPTGSPVEAPSDHAELAAWASASLGDLVGALEKIDVTHEMWTFLGVRPAGFYPRRMALENTVHRWDAEQALGENADPIDGALATDGIDEFFEVHAMRNLGRKDAADHPTGTFHLHRTDGEGEWMAELVDGELQVTAEHGKGDAAVRGNASDLYLYLWGRGAGQSIEIFGDASVAAGWSSIPA